MIRRTRDMVHDPIFENTQTHFGDVGECGSVVFGRYCQGEKGELRAMSRLLPEVVGRGVDHIALMCRTARLGVEDVGDATHSYWSQRLGAEFRCRGHFDKLWDTLGH